MGLSTDFPPAPASPAVTLSPSAEVGSRTGRDLLRLAVVTLGLWMWVRVCAVWASTIRPLRPIEELVEVFPVQPLNAAWHIRVWLSPVARWDVVYYQLIAARGYVAGDGTTQFHPLYPGLAGAGVLLGLGPLFALTMVGLVSALALVGVAYLLVRERFGSERAYGAALLLVGSPLALSLMLPYSESLFLLGAAACLWAMGRQRWWTAGLAGGLATLTRQQGLFLVLPYAVALYGHLIHPQVGGRRSRWSAALAWILIPAAYALWLAYRWVALGDLVPDFGSVHGFVYSVLISPSAARVVPVQTFTWPWQALALALQKLGHAPDADIAANLLCAGVFLGMLASAWRWMQAHERAYAAVVTSVSFGYYTGPTHPYMGLPRHLLLALPVMLVYGMSISRSPWRAVVFGLGALGTTVLTVMYALESWVP